VFYKLLDLNTYTAFAIVRGILLAPAGHFADYPVSQGTCFAKSA